MDNHTTTQINSEIEDGMNIKKRIKLRNCFDYVERDNGQAGFYKMLWETLDKYPALDGVVSNLLDSNQKFKVKIDNHHGILSYGIYSEKSSKFPVTSIYKDSNFVSKILDIAKGNYDDKYYENSVAGFMEVMLTRAENAAFVDLDEKDKNAVATYNSCLKEYPSSRLEGQKAYVRKYVSEYLAKNILDSDELYKNIEKFPSYVKYNISESSSLTPDDYPKLKQLENDFAKTYGEEASRLNLVSLVERSSLKEHGTSISHLIKDEDIYDRSKWQKYEKNDYNEERMERSWPDVIYDDVSQRLKQDGIDPLRIFITEIPPHKGDTLCTRVEVYGDDLKRLEAMFQKFETELTDKNIYNRSKWREFPEGLALDLGCYPFDKEKLLDKMVMSDDIVAIPVQLEHRDKTKSDAIFVSTQDMDKLETMFKKVEHGKSSGHDGAAKSRQSLQGKSRHTRE